MLFIGMRPISSRQFTLSVRNSCLYIIRLFFWNCLVSRRWSLCGLPVRNLLPWGGKFIAWLKVAYIPVPRSERMSSVLLQPSVLTFQIQSSEWIWLSGSEKESPCLQSAVSWKSNERRRCGIRHFRCLEEYRPSWASIRSLLEHPQKGVSFSKLLSSGAVQNARNWYWYCSSGDFFFVPFRQCCFFLTDKYNSSIVFGSVDKKIVKALKKLVFELPPDLLDGLQKRWLSEVQRDNPDSKVDICWMAGHWSGEEDCACLKLKLPELNRYILCCGWYQTPVSLSKVDPLVHTEVPWFAKK